MSRIQWRQQHGLHNGVLSVESRFHSNECLSTCKLVLSWNMDLRTAHRVILSGAFSLSSSSSVFLFLAISFSGQIFDVNTQRWFYNPGRMRHGRFKETSPVSNQSLAFAGWPYTRRSIRTTSEFTRTEKATVCFSCSVKRIQAKQAPRERPGRFYWITCDFFENVGYHIAARKWFFLFFEIWLIR